MAYDFNGTSDYMEATAGAVTAVPLTLAAWFYTSTAANPSIMSVAASAGGHRWSLVAAGAVAGDPIRAFTESGGTTNSADTTSGWSNNTWTHACAVFSANNNRRAYINGGSEGTNTTTRTPTAGLIDRTTIGSSYTSAGARASFPGRVAEACVWNAALTIPEIEALARGVRPSLIRPQNLVFYTPIVREAIDISRGLSLTVSGASVIEHPRRIA